MSAPCNFTTPVAWLNDNASIIVYYYATPIYFLLAFTGRLLSLIAFYIKSKTEPAYLFQIFISIAETCQVTTFSLYIWTRYVLNSSRFVVPWFRRCRACVFYDSHFSNPLQMSCMFWTLLLSICMTCDRVYAMGWPVQYNKYQHHRRRQWLIFLATIPASFLASFFGAFVRSISDPDPSTGMYRGVVTTDWLVLTLIEVHVSLKIACGIILGILDTVCVLVYGSRIKKKTGIVSDQRAASETRKARTLFLLTLIQATLSMLTVSGEFAYNLINWLFQYNPEWGSPGCILGVMGPLVDGMRQIYDMAAFYVMLAMVRPFRRMIYHAVKVILRKHVAMNAVSSISERAMTRQRDRND